MTLRYDAVRLGRAQITPEGWIKDQPILTRAGVFEYRRADGSVRRELRPREEVFHPDHLASFRGIPITVDHPGLVNADNHDAVIGASLAPGAQDGANVMGDIVIHKPKAMGDRRELSAAYSLRLDETPGVCPEFGAYDAIQRGMLVNHIAAVPKGRAGNARLRLDADDAVLLDPHNQQEGGMPDNLVAVRLDGIPYMVPPEVERAVTKAQADLAAANARADQADAARDAEKARADAATASVEQARADAATSVRARLALEAQCATHGVEVRADATDRALREAVIAKVGRSVPDLATRSDAYVDAAFDLAVADATRADSNAAGQMAEAKPAPVALRPSITSAAAARDAMIRHAR